MLKKTLGFLIVLSIFMPLHCFAQTYKLEKTWKDSKFINSKIESLDLNLKDLPGSPTNVAWTKVTLYFKVAHANGDVYVRGLADGTKEIGIDVYDRKSWDNFFNNPEEFGIISVIGHFSKKRLNHHPEAEVSVVAEAKKISDVSNKNILFAHGMNDSNFSWNTFAKYTRNEGYRVFKTNVSGCGSIATRASELADYINRYSDIIPDNSLIVIAHSMGGLDVRYIVGEANTSRRDKYVKAAKKIKSVYTIATPHAGVAIAELNIIGYCTPAVDNLKNDHMEMFNKKYPFSNFKNPMTGKTIDFSAYHFQCPLCTGATDCMVGTNNQTWKGAPGEPGPSRKGSHAGDKGNCKAELSQIDVLKHILQKGK